MFVIFSVRAQDSSVAKGLSEERIVFPCGNKPNCISTTEQRESFKIQAMDVTDGTNLSDIVSTLQSEHGPEIIENQENYAHVVYRTLLFKFPDDIELTIKDQKILMRSQSRAGESDIGKNRKRYEEIKTLLKSKGLIK